MPRIVKRPEAENDLIAIFVYLGPSSRATAERFLRAQDSDQFERSTVEPNLFPNGGWVGAKGAPPKPIADYGNTFAALGAVALVLLALTLVWNDWIELLFRIDPDAGSGSLEWAICIALIGSVAVVVPCRLHAIHVNQTSNMCG